MKPVKIMTDTCSDITPEVAEKYGIKLLPIHIIFGEEEYLDGFEISANQFYEKLASDSIHPKTAQITVQEHIDAFTSLADDYEIIYVPISANASGTYQSAMLARNTVLDEKEDAVIHVFENSTFSYGYGYWVIEAAKMASDGKSSDEILSMLSDKISSTDVILNVQSLDFLQKGGRISSASKIIANVLDISPILAIEGGLVVSRTKVRGSKKVFSKMVSMVEENCGGNYDQTICIMTGTNPEVANKLIEIFKEKTNFRNFVCGQVGPCVGTHTGPDVFGIVYQTK